MFQLIGNENEEANQSSIVQYVHEMNFVKDLIENSLEYAVAYEKHFHTWKFVDVIMDEYCGQR